MEIIKCSRDLVLDHPGTLRVPHYIFAILLKSQTQQQLAQYEAELFTSEHITFQRCTMFNPTTLLPTELSDDILHDCLYLVHDAELPQPNLTDLPLQNPDIEFFTDGSSYVHEGKRVSGAAVVSLYKTVWASVLPSSHSAQAAEILALTKVCEAAKNWSANIYTLIPDMHLGFAMQWGLCGNNGGS